MPILSSLLGIRPVETFIMASQRRTEIGVRVALGALLERDRRVWLVVPGDRA